VALWGMSFALVDLSATNDISPAIIHKGVSILLVSISIGLTATILLAVYYAVTKAIFKIRKSGNIFKKQGVPNETKNHLISIRISILVFHN
jgi:hypothetical protein